MAPELLRALAQVKRACAYVNHAQGTLETGKATVIIGAADEIIVASTWRSFRWSSGRPARARKPHEHEQGVLHLPYRSKLQIAW